MKRKVLLLTICLLITHIMGVKAQTGTTFTAQTTEGIDMVFTILDESEKTCQVGYLDGAWDKTAVNKSVKGSLTIPNIANGYKVVKIGQYSLNNVDGMRSITIPNTVTSIDDYAFFSCDGLTSFELPASVTTLGTGALSAFWNVTSLTVAADNPNYDSRDNCNAIIEKATNKIVAGCQTTIIPASVTGIGTMAFDLFRGSIFIPSTITTIEESAFSCSNVIIQVERTTPLEINTYAFNDNITNSTLRVPAGSKSVYAAATGWKKFGTILEGNEGSTFTAQTTEGIDMVFTILNESEKTCQVGYIDGSFDKPAINKEAVNGSLTIPNIVNGYTVVKIGKWALNNVDGMTSITIPNTVTSFDDYAFHSCDGLESFELPASVTTLGEGALSSIWNVTSLTVAAGNTTFDSRDNCNAIIEKATNKIVAGCQTTTIPASVTKIGTLAFDLSRGSIYIPSTVSTIEERAFICKNVTIQVERTTPLEINENVFDDNMTNSALLVPEGCRSAYAEAAGWNKFSTILESTFTAKTTEGIDMVFTILDDNAKTCQVGYIDGSSSKLAVDGNAVNGQVTIPSTVNGYTVVKIGKNALFNVYKMTSVSIPNSVTTIDEYAFSGCWGLTSFELPANVTTIGANALDGFDNVNSIKVAEGNSIYDSRDNCNAIIETATNKLLFGYRITTIPATVTEIGRNAFFFGSSFVFTLTIPSTINKIDDFAIMGGNLILQVEHTTPLEINENAINLQNSILRVPAGRKAVYASAIGWNKFETIMEGNEGTTFTANTTEGYEMVFTILDDNEKTCQVGYLDGAWDKLAVDNDAVEGPVTIPETVNGYTVVKIGRYAFQNTLKMTSITIPNTVTGIDNDAFGGCWGMTNLEIPASVTSIGDDAFYGISKASSISVKEGNTKYDSRDNCNAIIETTTNKLLFGCKNTIIPSTVTEIGREAFAGLNNCTLTIPSTITKIGELAFSDCLNTTIQVEHTVPLNIDESVFQELSNSTLLVPAGCISAYAAATGWNKFSTIMESTFTATVEGIDMVFTILDDNAKTCQVGYLDGSFDKPAINKEAVNGSLTIPNIVNGYTVVKIGKWALNNVDGMTSITIPNTVTSFDDYAFHSCDGLESFELPASVTSLGEGALSSIWNVTSLTVAEGNTTFDSRDNCNAIIESATNKIVAGCQTTTIPASVTKIGTLAFDLSRGSIFIPSTVSTIEERAFICKNVTIQVESTTPLEINTNAFDDNMINSTLRVPAGRKSAYAAATGWKNFGVDNIVEVTNVTTAGTLSSLISDEDKFNITDLTITGELNGTDFRLLREMAGNDYTGHPTEGKLEKLDLSGVTIVEGGSYAEFQDNMCDLGDHRMASAYISDFNNNSLPSCLFLGCSKLQEIKLPSSIVAIETGAFRHTGLTSFIVPKSTATLGTALFTGCDNLISLDVESGNTTYSAEDNAIIETSTNRLVVACKNTTIPSEVLIIGQNAFYNSGETIVLPANLNKIERSAFSGTSLKSINIPASVSEIEGGAFASCDDLIGITVDGGNTKYESPEGSNAIIEKTTKTLVAGCQSTVIPSDVTAIGAGAFLNNINKNSTSITLPASITSIGREAFYSCAGLASINLPTSITSIDEYAFANNSNLTVTVESTTPLEINENVFQSLSNSTLRVPAGCKSVYAEATGWNKFSTILESTFTVKTSEGIDMVFTILDESAKTCQVGYSDGSWEKIAVDKNVVEGSVTIPSIVNDYTVVKIGQYSLNNVDGMTSITIPNTVTSIDDYAFFSCDGLTSFELPASVTTLGTGALSAFWNVTSLTVAADNPNYDSRDNCNAIIEKATNKIVAGCQTTIIPANVTGIGTLAFDLSRGSIFIPSTVTTIEESAFRCINVTIQVERTTPLVINTYAFNDDITNSTLRVPAGCKSAYAEATGWSKFGADNIIEENKATINVETAGGLSAKLSDPLTITDLTITGQLNGTDFRLLRAMAGNDYTGHPTNGKLQKLDLSGVTIVEGGDTYFESDGIYRADGSKAAGKGSKSLSTGNYVVGPFLFAGCTQLSEVKIPSNTKEIGDWAFMMTNISALDIPEGVEKVWPSFSYDTRVSTITIPETVTDIVASVAQINPSLSSIIVDPDNEKYDSRNNCNAIMERSTNTLVLGCKNTIIPDNTEIIGSYAFSGDTGESITLPQGLLTIKQDAFNSSSIKSIAIPASVSLIEDMAFVSCYNLATITVDALNETYKSPEGSNAIIEKSTKTLIAGCKSTIIPSDVKAIGAYVFNSCNSLASITIPASIESIGDYAFGYCNNLTSVTVEAVNPLVIDASVFSGPSTNATLYVPAGSKAKYKAATGWKDFNEIIETISVFSGTNLWAGYVAAESFALPTGLKAYVITSLDATTATASPLDYIPQGVPVLLKRENTSDNNFEMSAGSGTAPTVNLLKTYESAKNVSNREGFILYNDEFVLVNEGTLPAGRVFLPANKSGVALTRGIVTEGDDTTGIYNSKMDFDDSDKQWYDLQGRKLERKPTKKGIYILDGRKVVIK